MLLSSAGLGLVVFAILKSSEWGLIEPRGALTIGGEEITPFGFSAVPFLIMAGLGLLAAFVLWEDRRERRAATRCSTAGSCASGTLRAGLTTLMMQQLILLGTFFVHARVPPGGARARRVRDRQAAVPAVRGDVHRRDGRAPSSRRASRRSGSCRSGCSRSPVASVLLLGTIDVELDEADFAVAMAVFGVGAGLMLSQLGNVIMSSVEPAKTNEAGGLQGTAQNLGASLGTALIGAVLLAALSSNVIERVERNPDISPAVREQVVQVAEAGHADRPGGRGRGRRRSTRARRPPRRRRSPPTTARRSCTASSARSARSACSRCSRSGSRAACPAARRLDGRSAPRPEPRTICGGRSGGACAAPDG